MLRVVRLQDRTGRYYLGDLARELDASSMHDGDGRSFARGGRWVGDGAAGLGLHGTVDAAPFASVLAGRHPTDGHRLRLRETRLSAYDLTFAASKSASVLFALGGTRAAAAVRSAHEEAVEAATAYVAEHAATVRRSEPDGRVASPVDGLVAASFTHGVSRALDPHLHSHVVVANLARGEDGRWRALDGRGLYAHAQAAGSLYDAVLRHGVTERLGLQWVSRHPRGWELSAVDPVLTGAFSARRAEILAHLDVQARRVASTQTSLSRRARRVAWAVTRDPKAPSPSPEELRARWAAVAHDLGCAVEPITQAQVCRETGEVDEHRFAAVVAEAGRRGVARRDALRAWAGSLRTGGGGDEIARCVDALWDWGGGGGVAEPLHPPAAVVPPPHVLRVLGPRPSSPERLAIWSSAASSIARYRARWDVHDRWRVLGAETRSVLASMPAQRLAEHLSTARAIDEALGRLGGGPVRERRAAVSRALVRDGL